MQSFPPRKKDVSSILWAKLSLEDIFSVMKIAVLVVEGMFDLGLALVLDTLTMANGLSAQAGLAPHFSIQIVGVRQRVHTQQGLLIPSVHISQASRPDLVIVPALGDMTPEGLERVLLRADLSAARKTLVQWSEAGARVAAACTGTYVLASAGLLDGLTATTSWWLTPDFRKRFPTVEVNDSKMVVAQEGRITAGAALAHVDLALWLIREHSPTLASTTSRYLLFDGRPSQSTYAMTDHLAHTDPLVERFERWARANLASCTMAEAARAVGASERTLERRIRKALGRTPIGYVRDLRVEQAVYRLETTDESVEEIARAVGYQDGVTLRALLKEKTGQGVRELRGNRPREL